jgi:hypothetical protein
MAYGDLSREQAAAAMEVSTGNLSRIYDKKGKETKTATVDQLWALADACGLPREFFAADFARLGEIAYPGAPVPATPRPLADVAAEAARLRDDKSQQPPQEDEGRSGSDRAA